MLALFTGLVLGQDPSCPCLTSFPNSVTLNANGNLDITLGGVTYEYPSTYGLGPNCSAADTGLSPYCSATTPPEWCADAWCYVDSANCGVTYSFSQYISGLAFSYFTCGGSNTFDDWFNSSTASSYQLSDLTTLMNGCAGPASKPTSRPG